MPLSRCAEGKVRFRDKKEALRALHRMQHTKDRKPCRVYYHHDCRGWHVTSKELRA